MAEGAHATERLLERLSELARRSVTTAAQFFGIPQKTAEGLYYQYLERKRDPADGGLSADRVAGDRRAVFKKRHCQFCCVLIDHTIGRVLNVLQSRDKTAVLQWLKAGKEPGLLSALEEVTCDMWDAHAEAPREVFGPAVRITIDRFHVIKNFQDRLNDARREIQRRLGKEQAEQLKGSRWLWVTNPENLTAEQQAGLEVLKRKFPDLGRLADHREALRRIFEDHRIKIPATAFERLRR